METSRHQQAFEVEQAAEVAMPVFLQYMEVEEDPDITQMLESIAPRLILPNHFLRLSTMQ